MELKGVEKINKILDDFLEPFGCTSDMGPDFCYWVEPHIIDYTLTVSEEFDNFFQDFIEEKFSPSITMDIFMWSFFHELGHHMTENTLTEEQQNESWSTKNMIESPLCPIYGKERFFLYAELPDEWAATSWAVAYVENHFDIVKNLWDNLRVAILDFYEENGIEED